MPLSKIVAKSITDNTITTDQIADTSVHGRRNLVTNGAMRFNQRRASSTGFGSSSDTYAVHDRFRLQAGSSGTFTISQSTESPDGFSNSMKIDCTALDSSPNYFVIVHRMEGQNLQHLQKGTSGAKSVTVSFYVRSNKTGTYQLNLLDTDNTRMISGTYTINSADTWEYKSLTFAGDTSGSLDNDNNNSLQLEWWIASGSTYNSGAVPTAWEAKADADRAAGLNVHIGASTDDEFYLTGVQMEVGSKATPFEHREYSEELLSCQRYLQLWNLGSSYQGGGGFSGALYSPDLAFVTIPYFCEMRAAPTGGITAASTWQLINPSDAPDAVNSISMYGQGKMSATIQVDASTSSSTPTASATSGVILWPDNSSSDDAFVRLDAEL